MTNEEYWKKRAEELLEDSLKDGDKVIKKIKKAYKKADKDIKRDIEALMFKYMKQTRLGYNATSRLLTNKELFEWRMDIEDYLDEIENANSFAKKSALTLELNTLAMQSRISRLEALRGDIKVKLGRLAMYEESLVTKTLESTIKINYYNDIFEFHKSGVISEDMIKEITDNDLETLLDMPFKGKNYSERIWKRHYNIADRINEKVTANLTSGRSLERLQEELHDEIAAISTEPLRQSMDYDIKRLVHTEVAHAKAQANLKAYKDAGTEEYRFIATFDIKTSDKCRKLSSKVFKVEDAVIGTNFPPMHPHCRSKTVGISEYFNGKTRIARDKNGKNIKIPVDMTYDEWYEKYVASDPEYLAKEKGYKNRFADKKQHEKYRSVLGNKAPRSFEKFQQMKYNDVDKYGMIKLDYSRKNRLITKPDLALPNVNKAMIDENKYTKYLFDGNNEKGLIKGELITKRLGYDINNYKKFEKEILEVSKLNPAKLKKETEFGYKYEQKVVMYGIKDKPTNVVIGWNVKDDKTHLTTIYVKEVE